MKLAAIVFATLAVSAMAQAPFKWDRSCGTQYDRLVLKTLDAKSSAGKWTAGSTVTLTGSGDTNLHAPLKTGAWSVKFMSARPMQKHANTR